MANGNGTRNPTNKEGWEQSSVDRSQDSDAATPTPVFTRGTSFARTGGAGSNSPLYTTFADPSDTLANLKGQYFEIYHIPTRTNVFFKAFITEFQDNFKPEYNKEQLFGRMDPIVTYKSTGRTISLSWTVPSVSLAEAKENMAKANMLISMLYPVYESAGGTPGSGGATTMKSGPIFKVKFGNLICKPGIPDAEVRSPASSAGLPCIIEGFTYNPIFDEGVFDPQNVLGWDSTLYPQTIEAKIELTVLHDSPLGFDASSGDYRDKNVRDSGGRFPYGGNNETSVEERLNDRAPLPVKETNWRAHVDLQKDLANRRLGNRARKLLQPAQDIKKLLE